MDVLPSWRGGLVFAIICEELVDSVVIQSLLFALFIYDTAFFLFALSHLLYEIHYNQYLNTFIHYKFNENAIFEVNHPQDTSYQSPILASSPKVALSHTVSTNPAPF